MVELGLRESPGLGKRSVNQGDGDSDLGHLQAVCEEISTKEQWYLLPLQSEESFPSSLHCKARQFSSSLNVPGAFRDAVPLLELRVSVCEQVSLWLGPLRECLESLETSISLGWSPC